MKTQITLLILFPLLLVIGCNSNSSNDTDTEISLEFNNLKTLQNGFHYEGWLIIDEEPITTGKFNINENGDIVDLDGDVIADGVFTIADEIDTPSAFVLTIEPAGDIDEEPAETHHLAGSISNGMASLSMSHEASLGDDFSGSSGDYILATPTDGVNENENSGVWFVNPSSGTPMPGLDLPSLPAGWKYEGWAVYNEMPITTGTFTSTSEADDFNDYSGSQGGPPFPGEDFLMNAPDGLTFPLDLSGGMIVISIEPSPDDSPAPFALKPLVGTVPSDASDRTVYMMNNNSETFPDGTVRIN